MTSRLTRLALLVVAVLLLAASSAFAGAVVPSAPTGPAVPSGGWQVVYADAFGSCLADTNTLCSASYGRSDNTLAPATNKNGAGNSNEVVGLEPYMDNVTSQGLVLHADPASVSSNPFGDPYTAGAVTGGAGYSSPSPGAFHWSPGAGKHFVLEADIQMPPNQGNMDPSFWSNGPADVPEVDHPELWGMNHPVPTGATNSWKGYMFGDPAVPFDNGVTGNVQLTFGSGPVSTVDPSLGLHKWTLDENGNTITSYLDGVKLGSKIYSPFNSKSASFKLLLMLSMRKDAKTGLSYPLPAGGSDMIVRYVSAYAPASQGVAGSNGPIVVPGTSVQ